MVAAMSTGRAMEQLNEKIKTLKRELSALLKMESVITVPENLPNYKNPTEAIKKEIELLSVQRGRAKEFHDKVDSLNEGILDLRTSFEKAEEELLSLLASNEFVSKDDHERVSKDLEKLKETRVRLNELKMFKPKNSVVDVDGFSKRISSLIHSVESSSSDVHTRLLKEREGALSKEHELKSKINSLLEEKDFALNSLKQEMQKEMQLLEARLKGDYKIILVHIDEMRKIMDTKASEKSINVRLTEIEAELNNLYNLVSGVRKNVLGSDRVIEHKGKFSRVIDFLAGEK